MNCTEKTEEIKSVGEEIVSCLVFEGADVNCKNNEGLSPFLWTIVNDRLDLSLVMIEDGNADLIGTKIENGNCLIHYAIEKNYQKLIDLILHQHFQYDLVSCINLQEDTALHYAIRYSNYETAYILIGKKSDFTAKNKEGKDPFDYLSSNTSKYKEILDPLLDSNNLSFFLDSNFSESILREYSYRLGFI